MLLGSQKEGVCTSFRKLFKSFLHMHSPNQYKSTYLLYVFSIFERERFEELVSRIFKYARFNDYLCIIYRVIQLFLGTY